MNKKKRTSHQILLKLAWSLAMLWGVSSFLSAQQLTIHGNVTDTNKEPLIGVSVIVKGTTMGTVTDMDGNYSINASGNQTLDFSYVGMQKQTVAIDNRKNIRIVMQEDSELLEDVVVIGYGSVKRKDVTTSVSTVSTKDIAERPITSAAQAIQGKAAGIQVIQTSGKPGGEMVVRVRGNSSMNSGNDPLYVVDGVPMTSISFLSPNDIESMQVLKDASSAAIYGSRASNGVVLITTKTGKNGEAKISFSAYAGISNVIKQMTPLNTAQYKDLMDEIGILSLPDGLTDQTDWFKETYRTGINQNYQLSISNASDKMSYFISGGYTEDKGIISSSFFKRYNLRVNLENQIRSWFKITTNLAYSDMTDNGIIEGTGASRAGVILSVINTPRYAPIWDAQNEGWYYNNFYGAKITHPIENISRSADNRNNSNRLIGSIAGDISFTKDLKLRSSVNIDRNYYHATTWTDPIATAEGRGSHGNASDKRSLGTVMMYDNILTYDKSFGKNNLSALVGTSYTSSLWSESNQSVSHFANGDIKTLNAGNKVSQGNGTSAADWAIMSYIGRLSYNYDSKYLVTANIRSDGSSKLAPAKRWGYFPSFSAAWRISSESFMNDIKEIDDLKIRVGWGQTGNQSGVGDYAYLQRYNINRQNWWETGKENALVTLSPANMKNENLTWETSTQTNIGLDLSLFNGRLTFTADAYYKYTTDLLMNVPLASSASVSTITRNEGEMENKGLEFAVSSKNFTGKFSWDTDFNISFNRNKVTKLNLQQVYYFASTSEATSENIVRMTVGQPLSMFWGYVSEGVDPETGDLKFKDLNNSGSITTSDKTYIGNPNPDFIFGLTNNLSYKGFSLNIFLQGSVGNDVYNASRIETEGMYNPNNQTTAVLDRWQRPGQVTYMPRAVNGTDNLRASTRFVEDGSYLRLKSLTLAYNFKNNLLKKYNIGRIQPYITAQNLFTITNYKGFDPEVNQWGGNATVQGVDWGTYPQVKTFIVGLNIEF